MGWYDRFDQWLSHGSPVLVRGIIPDVDEPQDELHGWLEALRRFFRNEAEAIMTLGLGGFVGWWFAIESQPKAPGVTPHPFWSWQPILALCVGVFGLVLLVNRHRHPTSEEDAAKQHDEMASTLSETSKWVKEMHNVVVGGGAVDTPPGTTPPPPPPPSGTAGGGTVDTT